MSTNRSSSDLSAVIGQIYDGVVEPRRWPIALESMCDLIDAAFGSISVFDPSAPAVRFVSSWGGDPYWINLLGTTYANLMPFMPVLDQFPIGMPFNMSMAAGRLGDVSVWEGAFVKEWVRPAGYADAASAVLQRSHQRMVTIALTTASSRPPVTKRELDVLAALAPHIRRAVIISDLIEMKSLAAAVYERTLDTLQNGVITVDEGCRVRHANTVAIEMFETGNPLSTVGDRIQVTGSPEATLALHEAVHVAATDEHEIAGAGANVPLRFADDTPAIAYVLPLHARSSLGGDAGAAIFIATPGSRSTPIEAMSRLYELTHAETRVLGEIAFGKNRGEVAAALNVADSTIKTHLDHIFTKTGTSSQAELSHLIADLSSPVLAM